MAYAPFAGFSAVTLGAATGSHRLGGQTMGDSPSAWTSGTSTISPSSTTRSRRGTSGGPPLTFFTRDMIFLSEKAWTGLLPPCSRSSSGYRRRPFSLLPFKFPGRGEAASFRYLQILMVVFTFTLQLFFRREERGSACCISAARLPKDLSPAGAPHPQC